MHSYRFVSRTGWKDFRWAAGQVVHENEFPPGTTLLVDLLAAGVIVPVEATPPAPVS